MRAPVRFREDPSAPTDVRELVQSAGRSRPLPRDARARSIRRLDRLVVAQAAAGLVLWAKGVAFAGLCVVGAAAAVHVVPALVHRLDRTDERTESVHEKPRARPAPVAMPLRALERPPTPDPAASDSVMLAAIPSFVAPEPAAVARDRVMPPAPSASSVPESTPERDPLEREAAMLEEARAMLDRHPSGALAVLDRHAVAFPAGQLGMERELLAVQALRRLGRLEEARARGDALLRQATGSIYEVRVRAMMDELTSP
jgi:hypothetical protein